MDIKELRRIIRSSVRRHINESLGKLTSVPKTLNDFRSLLAAAMRASGAPDELVDEVADADLQGGGVFGAIWDAWQNIESEMRGVRDPAELAELWQSSMDYYIHDCVIDMMDEWNNPMNYPPGHKPERVDSAALAKEVVATLSSMLA